MSQCILLVMTFLESEILALTELEVLKLLQPEIVYFLDLEILLELHPLQAHLFIFA